MNFCRRPLGRDRTCDALEMHQRMQDDLHKLHFVVTGR